VKIFVTGGAGFIGQSLIAALPPRYEVVVVDSLERETHGDRPSFPAPLSQRAHCIRSDVADTGAWKDAAAGSRIVIHLAALTGTAQSARQAERYRRANLTATSRLCDGLASLARGPERLILASSRAVYGEGPYLDPERGDVVFPSARSESKVRDAGWEPTVTGRGRLQPVAASEDMPTHPVSVYAATKVAQERRCAAFASACGVETMAVRLQNVYGPGQDGSNPHAGVVAAIARAILDDRSVELFEDGEMTRDFVHIDDAVGALLWAIETDALLPRTVNIGTGRRTSLRALVNLLSAAAGRQPAVICSGRFRPGDVRHAVADTSAWARRREGWHPAALESAIPAYLDWLIDQRVPSTIQ
jgi:dTDP-L-rhamnose 4-epimerase